MPATPGTISSTFGAEGVPERTVLHCFTGGPEEAKRCLDAGMFVSFSGIVTFKNAAPVRDAAALVPIDRLLVETDSPFLAPVPFRGRSNEPALVPVVGARPWLRCEGWRRLRSREQRGRTLAAPSLWGLNSGPIVGILLTLLTWEYALSTRQKPHLTREQKNIAQIHCV